MGSEDSDRQGETAELDEGSATLDETSVPPVAEAQAEQLPSVAGVDDPDEEEPGGDPSSEELPAEVAPAENWGTEPELADGEVAQESETLETDEWGSRFDRMAEEVSELNIRLEESQRLLSRQSDLVERLHTENQALRGGELRGALTPMVRDLLRLHDDIGHIAGLADDTSERDFELISRSLLEVLARNGVERFAPKVGDAVDAADHQVAGVDAAETPDLDRAVSEVMKAGFRWTTGELVRTAEIRAFRYREEEPNTGAEPAETTPPPEASGDQDPDSTSTETSQEQERIN